MSAGSTVDHFSWLWLLRVMGGAVGEVGLPVCPAVPLVISGRGGGSCKGAAEQLAVLAGDVVEVV